MEKKKITILATAIYFSAALLFVGAMFACTPLICRRARNPAGVADGAWLAFFIFLLAGFFWYAYEGERTTRRVTFAVWTAGYAAVLALVKLYALFDGGSAVFAPLCMMPCLSGFYSLNSLVAEKVFKKDFALASRSDAAHRPGRWFASILYFLASLAAGLLLGACLFSNGK